jgi:hypothetical protein
LDIVSRGVKQYFESNLLLRYLGKENLGHWVIIRTLAPAYATLPVPVPVVVAEVDTPDDVVVTVVRVPIVVAAHNVKSSSVGKSCSILTRCQALGIVAVSPLSLASYASTTAVGGSCPRHSSALIKFCNALLGE